MPEASKAKNGDTHRHLLLALSLLLLIPLGISVFQALYLFNIDRTTDRLAVMSLSFFGIFLALISSWIISDIEHIRQERPEQAQISFHSSDKDIVLKDYEITNKEVERRDNIDMIVGTILVTASFVILGNVASTTTSASTTSAWIFPYALCSISLFASWLFVLHHTTAKLDSFAYERMRALERSISQHSGYAFGIHSYTYDKRQKDGKLVWWADIRRQFWGIILIVLSIFWLVISLLMP